MWDILYLMSVQMFNVNNYYHLVLPNSCPQIVIHTQSLDIYFIVFRFFTSIYFSLELDFTVYIVLINKIVFSLF